MSLWCFLEQKSMHSPKLGAEWPWKKKDKSCECRSWKKHLTVVPLEQESAIPCTGRNKQQKYTSENGNSAALRHRFS